MVISCGNWANFLSGIGTRNDLDYIDACTGREPRGFGFVQYMDAGDAAEAQYHMDHQVINGREITVVFAEENRKKPQEMRSKERTRY